MNTKPQITISDKQADAFLESFDRMTCTAHHINQANGWWDKRKQTLDVLDAAGIEHRPSLAIELFGLCSTEFAEGIEAARKHPTAHWGDPYTKDTMVRECAGAIVRAMDLCQFFELPLGDAIVEELRANMNRGHMHGGKAA